MANSTNRGWSYTILPAAYSSPESQFMFLDTRGTNHVFKHPEGNLANYILQDMAIDGAKSVRIVALIPYSDLQRGPSCLQHLGKFLNSIASIDGNLPIFFLFNQYSISTTEKESDYYKRMATNEEGENQFIIEQIKDTIQDLIQNYNRQLATLKTGVEDGIAEKLKFKKRNKQYEEFLDTCRYLYILENSFKAGNWGYIDPT